MDSVLAEKTATRRWLRSVGRGNEVDDVAFILATVEEVHEREAFDRRKLYVAGASNGGMMTMRLLIDAPTAFAAAATFAASLPEGDVPRPSFGTPLMMLNGTADPRVPWEGGSDTRPVEESVQFFVRANGSDPAAFRESTLPDNQRDGCLVYSQVWSSPRGSAPAVVFFRVEGGGHSIPDPTPEGPLSTAGPQCRDVHGVDLAWHFLKRHRGRYSSSVLRSDR
jgi:polyhydroxybutyrate depolymerase